MDDKTTPETEKPSMQIERAEEGGYILHFDFPSLGVCLMLYSETVARLMPIARVTLSELMGEAMIRSVDWEDEETKRLMLEWMVNPTE